MKLNIFVLIKALLPIIRDIVAAAKKDSPGGKKISQEEVEDLIIDHLPALTDVILKSVD
jgi:hypothetical protein